jgi:hypothetical protein
MGTDTAPATWPAANSYSGRTSITTTSRLRSRRLSSSPLMIGSQDRSPTQAAVSWSSSQDGGPGRRGQAVPQRRCWRRPSHYLPAHRAGASPAQGSDPRAPHTSAAGLASPGSVCHFPVAGLVSYRKAHRSSPRGRPGRPWHRKQVQEGVHRHPLRGRQGPDHRGRGRDPPQHAHDHRVNALGLPAVVLPVGIGTVSLSRCR